MNQKEQTWECFCDESHYHMRREHLNRLERELDEAREEAKRVRGLTEHRFKKAKRGKWLNEFVASWRIGSIKQRINWKSLMMRLTVGRPNTRLSYEIDRWKTEYEIVASRLRGKKHPLDNGIVAEDEVIPLLTTERDEARKEAEEYRRLLSQLYIDINITHSGYARRELNEMFRYENMN
jgi:hypothetical protein